MSTFKEYKERATMMTALVSLCEEVKILGQFIILFGILHILVTIGALLWIGGRL